MTEEKLFNYLHTCLPKIYWDLDKDTYLYRYLQALVEGGYADVLEDSKNLATLLDPQKCPDELLQFFYRSFGLTYFPDIAPIYHRRLLANLGGIIKRRGTYSCVEFLTQAISGTDVFSEYRREEIGGVIRRHLILSVICTTLDQVNNLTTEIEILSRFIREYIPYYIYLTVQGNVTVNITEDTRNDVVVASTSFDYALKQDPNQP